MDNTNLTLTDLYNVKSLIDLACQRGAFKASEMKEIGELYTKLDTFVNQMSSIQQPEPENATPSGE